MRHAVFEGIAQAFDHVHHQLRGLQRLDLGADLDEVAEVPALDELHDQVGRLAVGGDVVNGHDVGMPQREPQFAFAHELGGLARSGLSGRCIASQDLQGDDLARLAMHGAEHRGEVPAPTAYSTL